MKLARLAVLIKLIEDAGLTLPLVFDKDSGVFSSTFKLNVNNRVGNLTKESFLLSVHDFFKAKLLAEYFYKQYMIFLGYHFNSDFTLHDILLEILKQ